MDRKMDRQMALAGYPSPAAVTELKFWRQSLAAAPLVHTPSSQRTVRAVTWQVWVS